MPCIKVDLGIPSSLTHKPFIIIKKYSSASSHNACVQYVSSSDHLGLSTQTIHYLKVGHGTLMCRPQGSSS